MKTINRTFILKIGIISTLLMAFFLRIGIEDSVAQESASVLYVPLIGISLVSAPLALPQGPGNVTYNYAVKNFLNEVALTNVQVTDDKCSPVRFSEGDDNGNARLDYNETWRYKCTANISETTQSIATAIGRANNITAVHTAYATVVVGSDNPPPLVSIVNITKVAYPLSLPASGGDIAFTYKVSNPGIVPLSDVTVIDDKCSAMSKKLGDTNGNNLLDVNEVWIYTCSTHLSQTTTNTASVTAFANGLKAVGDTTIIVKVDAPHTIPSAPPLQDSSPNLPETGSSNDFKTAVWTILTGILTVLIAFLVLKDKIRPSNSHHKINGKTKHKL